MNLLPHPRFLKRQPGFYTLPPRGVFHLDAALPRETVLLPVAERLRSAAEDAGVEVEVVTGPPNHPRLAVRAFQSTAAPDHADGYALIIAARGIALHYRQAGRLRAA